MLCFGAVGGGGFALGGAGAGVLAAADAEAAPYRPRAAPPRLRESGNSSMPTVGVSSSGATVRITLPPDTSAPSQPGSLTAAPLDPYRVSLSWAASSDNVGVTGYGVYRNSALVATVTAPGYTDSGLSPSTTYSYTVTAFDAIGNTSQPATASATTPVPPDTQAPTAPGNLRATARSRRVTLTWSASSDNTGVTGYRVYRNNSLVATLPGTSLTYAQSNVPRGTQRYGVEAFDAAGNTSSRPAVSVYVF